MPTATKTAQPSKKAPAKSAGTAKKAAPSKTYTVKEIEAMDNETRKRLAMDERTAARKAKDAGEPEPPMPISAWRNDPTNAAKVEKSANKPTTRRVNFEVIPYPKGKTSYDLETQMVVCQGEPGPDGHAKGAKVLVRKFPTTTPEKRTAECRDCRDFRQGRKAKAAAKAVETAKVEKAVKKAPKPSETPATKATKTASKAAKAPAKASDAPESTPDASPRPSTRRRGAKAKELVAA